MKPVYFINVIFFLSVIDTILAFIDPISLGVIGGITSGLYYLRNPIKRYTVCKAIECCNEDYIIGDTHKLKYILDEKLYGQHLAQKVVVYALASHFSDKVPQKALTMSFHGWPGSGKNYVTRFIKETLYKEGKHSKFIHEFNARLHFPLASKAEEYKRNLQTWIKGNVSNCERSLFIFDEVDKMPENVLNAIKPFIDYNDIVENIDYRKAVFIFLSNTGGTIIKDHLLTLWERGLKRKDISLTDFEHLITKGAFNEAGGFHHSDTIKSNLIDHYIPFLPMEKEHVELCIRDQFKIRDVWNPSKEHIDEVMESVEWGPEPLNLFSTTGCKRLSQKVPIIAQKYRLGNYEQPKK